MFQTPTRFVSKVFYLQSRDFTFSNPTVHLFQIPSNCLKIVERYIPNYEVLLLDLLTPRKKKPFHINCKV